MKLFDKENIPYLIFILLGMVAFYFLIQTFSEQFYEFDPYMYLENAYVILHAGYIMAHPHLAYSIYANQTSNRFAPLMPYNIAVIYSLSNFFKLGADLQEVAQIYPPLLFILMSGLIFVLFERAYREKLGAYSKWIGLIGGTFLLSMPVLFQQFVGGMFQEEAFGFFSVIALLTTYYLAFKYEEKSFSILAGITYVAVLLGSKYFTVISIVVPAVIVIESLILFLNNDYAGLKKFIKMNSIIIAFATLGNLFLIFYHGGFAVSGFSFAGIFIPINLALLIITLVFSILLSIDFSKRFKIKPEISPKLNNFFITLGIMILASIPLLPKVIEYGLYLLSFSNYQGLPLFKTVQEFTPSPSDMSGYFGILFGSPLVYLGIIAVFTGILIYKFYKRENDLLAIMLIPMVYPLMYTALSLAKYISDGAIVLVLALTYVIAEICVKLVVK